jgi:carbon storage regulator
MWDCFGGLAPALLSLSVITWGGRQAKDAAGGPVMWMESGTHQATRKGLFQMLVLTRKRTESIKIGDDIVVTVIHTSAGSVKLGIQAPANVRVLRAELGERPVNPVAAVTHVAPMEPVADNSVASDAVQEPADDLLADLMMSAELFLNQFSDDEVASLFSSLDPRYDVAFASGPTAGSDGNDRTIVKLEVIAL